MELPRLISEFHQALDDEIREARQGKGRQHTLHDGRRIGAHEGTFLYSFNADFEIFLPDDSPVEVRAGSTTVRGFVVSVEGLTIILELQEDLGEEVPRAVMGSEPWYLLEALKERLADALNPETSLNAQLAQKVLGISPAQTQCLTDQAERLLISLRSPRNPSQVRAVEAALGSEVAFVWGPPGTGKTLTLGLIARALHEAGETLLVTSHSNAAVDMAIKALANSMAGTQALQAGRVVRFGSPRLPEVRLLNAVIPRQIIKRRNPQLIQAIERAEAERQQISDRLRHHSLPEAERTRLQTTLREVRSQLGALREQFRALELELVRSASVVACTLSKAGISAEVYSRRFDAVAVDEASMAYVPQVFFAATIATKRCIILGDFRQLPPVSLSETELAQKWLQRDVFDHAGIIRLVNDKKDDPRLWLLDTQYRMHPKISGIVNRVVYDGRLKDSPDVETRTAGIAAREPEQGLSVIFYDLSPLVPIAYREQWGQGFSHFNPFSAVMAFEVACRALEGGAQGVGVITPYAAQSRLIRRVTHDFRLNERIYPATVHRFQGSEREVVVFDVVDNLPMQQPGILLRGTESSNSLRLLNVAMSRPQGKLFLLGDLGYLRGRCGASSAFGAFLREILLIGLCKSFKFNDLREVRTVISRGAVRGIEWYGGMGEALRMLREDLAAAQREAVINWPDLDLDDALPADLVAGLRARGARLAVAAREAPLLQHDQMQRGLQIAGPPVSKEGCVLVDGSIFWILGWVGGFSHNRPSLRITLPGTATLLAELMGLRTALRAPEPQRVEASEGLGPCRNCSRPLWIADGRYGPYLRCQACNASTRLTPDAATRFAALSEVRCAICGGDAVGRRGTSGVFLGCRSYPECRWTANLRDYI